MAKIEEIILPTLEDFNQEVKEEPPDIETQENYVYNLINGAEKELGGDKMGEIYRISVNHWRLVCTQCFLDFETFPEFTVHIEEHLTQMFEETKFEIEELELREVDLANGDSSEDSDSSDISQRNKRKNDSDYFDQTVSSKRAKRSHNAPERKKYSCTECERSFGIRSNRNRHMLEAHQLNILVEENQLKLVKFDENTSGGIPCPECDACLSSIGNLKRHFISVHKKKFYFKCQICGTKFNRQRDLKAHCDYVHSSSEIENQFNMPETDDDEEEELLERKSEAVHCPECNLLLSTYTNLKRHFLSVHKKKYFFKCDDCGMEFNRKYDLNSHCNDVHRPIIIESQSEAEEEDGDQLEVSTDEFRCPDCNLRISTFPNLKRHYFNVHNKAYFLKCEDCGGEFNGKRDLKAHYNEFHRPIVIESQPEAEEEEEDELDGSSDRFRCPDCNLRISTFPNLKRHYLNVHKKTFFLKCEDCGGEFNGKRDMKAHYNEFHRPIVIESQPELEEEEEDQLEGSFDVIRCPDCKLRISTYANLKRHVLLIHKRIYFFKCEDCGVEFNRKRDLKSHWNEVHKPMIIESQPDGEEAEEEDDQFESSSDGIRCPDCNLLLSTYANLKRHVLSVHKKIYLFSCKICGSEFNTKWELNTHCVHMHRPRIIENDLNNPEDEKQLEPVNFIESTDRVRCPECKFFFSSIAQLKRHVLSLHKEEYLLNCKAYDNIFNRIYGINYNYAGCLERIIMEMKPETVTKGSQFFNDVMEEIGKFDRTMPEILHCPECNMLMSTHGNLKRHVFAIHNKEYIFDGPRKIKKPSETENDECKLSCPECGLDTTSIISLRSHIRRHSVNKTYRCKICKANYGYWEFLFLHLKRHHKLQRLQTSDMGEIILKEQGKVTRRNWKVKYECYMCRKPFDDVKLMKDHLDTHWKPLHSCKICGAEFKQQNAWRVHLVSHLP